MAVSQAYADFIVDELEWVAPITTRKMFGAIALYADGPIFGIIDDDVLYFKVDDSNRQWYVDAGSEVFMPDKDPSKVMRYYQVPAGVLEDRHMLADWMNASITVARNSKAKRPTAKVKTVKPKSAKANSPKAESAKAKSRTAESTQAASPKGKSTQAASAQGKSTQAASAKSKSTQAASPKDKSPKGNSPKSNPAKA